MKKNNKSEYYTGGETKMISESYIKDLLLSMGYIKKNHIYEKFFPSVDCYIKVDLKNRTIIYPKKMTLLNYLKMHIQFRNYIRCGMKRMKSDFREM